MMKFLTTLLLACFYITIATAQTPKIVSIFQGATTPTSAKVWLLVEKTDSFSILHSKQFQSTYKITTLNNKIKVIHAELEMIQGEEPFMIAELSNKKGTIRDTFHLKIPSEEATEFSFLAGSCVWPYGKKHRTWKIFDTMSEYPADFMLWMGDNIYLLFYEWNSSRRIQWKYLKYRKNPKVNHFMQQQPNFSAWDDHDFGPNDSSGNFKNKHKTFQAFQDFWANPSYGTENINGTFYSYTWQDCEFFVLDGRYYKTQQEMYGKAQMNWLKEKMLASKSRVKFIIGGSQFLSHTGAEDWGDTPQEKDDFLAFLKKENIQGTVFLSGDRHVAEMMLIEEKGSPRLLEITTSPLTSFVTPNIGSSKKGSQNKGRIPNSLIRKRNFAYISLLGQGAKRKIRVEIRGRDNELWFEYEMLVDDLKIIE